VLGPEQHRHNRKWRGSAGLAGVWEQGRGMGRIARKPEIQCVPMCERAGDGCPNCEEGRAYNAALQAEVDAVLQST
jgi:hypothetical protein